MLIAITLFFSIILLSACSGSTDEAPIEQKSRVTVDFSTFQVEVEDMGRGSRAALSPAATRLSFAVLKSDGTKVVDINQGSEDDDFGSVEVEIYPGTYQMVAVAHNGENDANIASTSSVTLPGTTFTDTFTKVQELTVVSNQDSDLSMTLPRITSAFILRLNDTPPANVKEIKVVVNTGGTDPTVLKIDPTTGLAENSWKQTCIIPKANLKSDVPIYFIKQYAPTVVNITATAYDTEGKVIINHTFSNVSLVPNKKTIATGTFFQSSGSGTFTIETTWEDNNNIEY